MQSEDDILRNHLSQLLHGGDAHVDFAAAVKDFPVSFYGVRPPNLPHSAWEILEHIRFTLHDLLEFSTNPDYLEPEWPRDYWPAAPTPPSNAAWRQSVKAIEEDLKAFQALIENRESNLYAEIPWAKGGQTLLREILLAATHTSYHLGELIFLRRVLGVWNH